MKARTALATLAALSTVALAGCGSDDASQASDPAPAPTTSSPADPAPTSSSAPPASDSGSPSDTVAVPLYFVGSTPQGPRLYREFQQLPSGDLVNEALAVLTGDGADDPDYSSLVSGLTLTSGTTDEALSITVAGGADRPSGMSDAEAKLAVQQVVFTVQGILQDRVPVTFTDAGGASTAFLGLQGPDGGFTQDEDDLALVNITQPQQGSEPGATFTASGVANSFEANVPWEVDDASGKKVLSGYATAEGWGDKLYPWQVSVDASQLPAGQYTFIATTDDASGGEGKGPQQDTKEFTLH